MRAGFLRECQISLSQTSPKMRHEKNHFNQYYAIAFDPIEIQTHQALQSDRLNLSFLKDFNVVGEKWPERVVKWPFLSRKFSGFFYKTAK